MKIMTTAIERLQKKIDAERAKFGDGSMARLYLRKQKKHAERLLEKHPALDYADELLEMVKGIARNCECEESYEYHAGIPNPSTGESAGTCFVCRSQALIEKIEGKKDGE